MDSDQKYVPRDELTGWFNRLEINNNRVENKVDDLGKALQELILLNERQMQQQDRINKQEQEIKNIQEKFISLEMKLNTWIQRGIGGWAVIVAAYAIAKSFIH